MTFLQLFSTAVRAPDHRGGLRVAVDHAATLVAACHALWPSERIEGWLTQVRQAAQTLQAEAMEPGSTLGIASAREREMDVYSHFLAPWDSDAPRALTARLQAIEGASLIHAMSQGQALKPTFIQGLKTVRGAWTPRRNRHADWTVAFEVLTSADSDLLAAAARCSSERPREFLLTVHDVLQGTVSPAVRDDVKPIPAEPLVSQPLGQDAGTAAKTEGPEKKPATNKPPRKESDPDESDPLRVLLRRAEFAPFREKLSLSPSYGTLPESPRVSRRLIHLRGLSHEQVEQVLT